MLFQTNHGLTEFSDAEVATISTLTRNIVDWCEAATADQVAEGRVWYAYAQDLAKQVTVNLRSKGLTVDFRTVAAIVAVTSNNMPWERQLRVTEPLVEALLRGQDAKKLGLGILFGTIDKAERIINGDMSALSGPKVTVFYLNIIGIYDKVTVDRHAVRCAVNAYTDENETGRWVRPDSRRRFMMEAAYYLAARSLSGDPATVQAIAWTAYRYSPEYRAGLAASKSDKRAARKAVK